MMPKDEFELLLVLVTLLRLPSVTLPLSTKFLIVMLLTGLVARRAIGCDADHRANVVAAGAVLAMSISVSAPCSGCLHQS